MQIKQRIWAVLAISVLATVSPIAFAEVKIAVVDVQRAILNSEEAKRLLVQIQEEFRTDENKISTIQTNAAALLERLQKDADVMSDDEKRRIQQEIESYNNDFVYERQKLQKAINTRQTELFSGTEAKIQRAIEDLVLKNDYDMILPRGAALYVGDLYDITRKVTEKLNEMDKASKPAS
ncbi:MAG: OmpH family outer membrane protein [Gammaproteobacteria bacterium]|nr:OmpH family outer membrane protein [Gammaproteobacteria bacterium]